MKKVFSNLRKQQMFKQMLLKLTKIDQTQNIESEITLKENHNLLLAKQILQTSIPTALNKTQQLILFAKAPI